MMLQLEQLYNKWVKHILYEAMKYQLIVRQDLSIFFFLFPKARQLP
jgi:hypothetical protein